jgi:TetR/AcrR family transcriptional regulator, ethionamide resistance regulator
VISPAASANPTVELDGRAPRAARRPGVEAKLFAAVERLVAGGAPFASLSIAQLVAEAGIARATFYLYFPDRRAFLLRIVDHARDRIAEPLAAIWGDTSFEPAAIDHAMRTVVDRFRENAAVISTAVDAAAVDTAIAARLDQHMNELIEHSAQALELARLSGKTRTDLRPRETAIALAWMMERVCAKVAADAEEAELEPLVETLSTIIRSSLWPITATPA